MYTCASEFPCLVLIQRTSPILWCFFPTDTLELYLLLSSVIGPLLFNLSSQFILGGPYLSRYLEGLILNVQLHFTFLWLSFTLSPIVHHGNDSIPGLRFQPWYNQELIQLQY